LCALGEHAGEYRWVVAGGRIHQRQLHDPVAFKELSRQVFDRLSLGQPVGGGIAGNERLAAADQYLQVQLPDGGFALTTPLAESMP
jgi:hypothetical protein